MENVIAIIFILIVTGSIVLLVILMFYCLFNDRADTVISYGKFIELRNSIELNDSSEKIGFYGNENCCFIKTQDDEGNEIRTHIGFKTIIDYLKYKHFITNWEENKEKAKREARKQEADQLIQSLLDKENNYE